MTDRPAVYEYSSTADIPAWPTRKRGPSKQVALWLSVGDAWERWCRRENIFLDSVAWRRQMTFQPGARVSVLDNMSPEFDAFTGRYADPADEFRIPAWDRVASDLDVLILWPWEWPRADHYRWDQAWDCASGVVFSPDAISYGPPRPVSSVSSVLRSPSSVHGPFTTDGQRATGNGTTTHLTTSGS